MATNTTNYKLIIGGSQMARARWNSGKIYKYKSSAIRRMKQISEAHDPGVASIWVLTQLSS